MKKILFVMLTAIIALSFASCESCDSENMNSDLNDLIYNVKATADGQVEFSWFNGGAKVNGSAELYQCNDTISIADSVKMEKAMLISDAIKSNDAETAKLAKEVNDLIVVNSAQGDYHLKIVGYVKYGPLFLRINEEYPKEVD